MGRLVPDNQLRLIEKSRSKDNVGKFTSRKMFEQILSRMCGWKWIFVTWSHKMPHKISPERQPWFLRKGWSGTWNKKRIRILYMKRTIFQIVIELQNVSDSSILISCSQFYSSLAKMCTNWRVKKYTWGGGFDMKIEERMFFLGELLIWIEMWPWNKMQNRNRMHFHHTFWHWICHKWVFWMHFKFIYPT